MNKSRRHPCEQCGSSDGRAYYPDGQSHCFSCGDHTFADGSSSIEYNYTPTEEEIEKMFGTETLKYLPIADRNISVDTCKLYGVEIEVDDNGSPVAQHYPVYTSDLDNPIRYNTVVRNLPKSFRWAEQGGPTRSGLFGASLFPRGSSKYITITEGHLDALAAYEMLGNKWPVVSLQNGADGAAKEIKRNLEYLESFERVYICFDRDKPGQAAAIQCAQVLSPNKARIVSLDPELKDACGYKIKHKAEEFNRTWWNASVYTPAGILSGDQVAERIKNQPKREGIPYPFKGLNKLTYGIRTREAVVITAPTGVGKTTLLREIQKSIYDNDPEARVGTLYLEEGPEDSGLGLMSIEASIPFHFPDVTYTKEQYEQAEAVLRQNKVYFYDSFGSNKVDEIISRIRYYVKGLGCKYVILDHLSIIVSDQLGGDERKLLDSMMTQLKTLTMELDMALICVVHENRQGQIRGTAGIEQLANIIIELDRDVKAMDSKVRRTTDVLVSKNRTYGRSGPACKYIYNEETGRLDEIDESEIVTQEDIDQVFGAVSDGN